MKPVQGWNVFEARAGRAAKTLLRHQGYDGGWGLTLTSVSSIVNTSEVLALLRAAGVGGKPARDALDFLTGAIREHCQPRHLGGRGENTRFVAFGLAGLLHHPHFFHQPKIAETAMWCIGWLDEHQVEHGWPEVSGVNDTSLHQTALVIQALARLQGILSELGPDLTLADGVDTITYGVPLLNGILRDGSPLIDAGLIDADGLRRTLGELTAQPYDEEFHAKLLQVIDLHLAARAFLS
ncbi:hypothetical protein [Streptomyces sp. AK02-01A]|uniref:hypothetical protein n=1 Tax=Streptomyces sp. AK02-01A TaxID=3028648 RepID=UPI0029B0701E|nr:hypothetical protein [Streptomyces sp. AK02-01A]MDX3851106.1 hypothetical protein [Streptomyces sp. AK02-01A]